MADAFVHRNGSGEGNAFANELSLDLLLVNRAAALHGASSRRWRNESDSNRGPSVVAANCSLRSFTYRLNDCVSKFAEIKNARPWYALLDDAIQSEVGNFGRFLV